MTVPKRVVKEYLVQLERIDGLDVEWLDARIAGNWRLHEDLGTLIHNEIKILKELRHALVKAAG